MRTIVKQLVSVTGLQGCRDSGLLRYARQHAEFITGTRDKTPRLPNVYGVNPVVVGDMSRRIRESQLDSLKRRFI